MNDNKINIVCIYKDKKIFLRVPDTMEQSDIQLYMECKQLIPKGLRMRRVNGCPTYSGISDGDEFKFFEAFEHGSSFILYGCPTASEINGLVPECMLVGFDGFIRTVY